MSAEAPASGTRPVLFGYWRSTAAYRVRIALNLKGLEWDYADVHLVREGGEQHQEAFRNLNPAGLVPTLVWGDVVLSQSLAICEYLEEVEPQPALLPERPEDRAWVRALAQDIACDVHPLCNLRVLQYLDANMALDDDARSAWMHEWMGRGFGTIEQRLQRRSEQGGREDGFCLGTRPGLADIVIVAQAYNADRFGFSLGGYPRTRQVVETCRELEPFRKALPENQPDAP